MFAASRCVFLIHVCKEIHSDDIYSWGLLPSSHGHGYFESTRIRQEKSYVGNPYPMNDYHVLGISCVIHEDTLDMLILLSQSSHRQKLRLRLKFHPSKGGMTKVQTITCSTICWNYMRDCGI